MLHRHSEYRQNDGYVHTYRTRLLFLTIPIKHFLHILSFKFSSNIRKITKFWGVLIGGESDMEHQSNQFSPGRFTFLGFSTCL